MRTSIAMIVSILVAWSPAAWGQWDGGLITFWPQFEQARPGTEQVVIVPTDPTLWGATTPYILCRRSVGCTETLNPSSDVLVIDAPVLDDSPAQLAAYRATLMQVLDLAEDAAFFPELPEVVVTDLGGPPAAVTNQDLTSVDTYQTITDAEVWWTGSAVRPEALIP